MSSASQPVMSLDPRIRRIATGIGVAIPEAQVRLFGSRAKGTARPGLTRTWICSSLCLING
jgi:hypothetical protein